VTLTKQQNGRFLAFVGPQTQHTEPFLGVSDTNFYCLRSWLDTKTGEVAHQLYVSDSYYGSPYDWNAAHEGNNKKLQFALISHNEITCDMGCAYADEFGAELPEALLRDNSGGMTVTFTAKDGKALPIAVSGAQIVEELGAVDAVRAKLAEISPAAAPAAAPAPTNPPAPSAR
jgi:hypothetical protein